VRRKFGAEALYFGGAFMAQEEAPMRISFTHIPDLQLEADGKPGGLASGGAGGVSRKAPSGGCRSTVPLSPCYPPPRGGGARFL